MSPSSTHTTDYRSPTVRQLRADLALALRAAAHHGLGEGVCNHFSVELPDGSGRFLLNPRGFLWSEVQADDIVLVDSARHAPRRPARDRADRDVHPRRDPPRCRQGVRAAHPHAVCYRAHAHGGPRPRHHAVAERDALSRPHRDRCAVQRPGARRVRRRAHRARHERRRRGISRQPRRGGVRRACRLRLRRPVLPRARLHAPGAGAADRAAAGAGVAAMAAQVGAQCCGERLQSELFFEALRRTL